MRYCCLFFCLVAHAQLIETLKPETIREFTAYQAMVDHEREERVRGQRSFQWIDEHPEKKRQAADGEIVTFPFTGPNGRNVSDGLVHDWVGAMYLKGLKLDAVRIFILDTQRHAGAYPEVRQAKTLSHGPNSSVTVLRIVKKKILTVVLDIEYRNEWQQPAPDKWVMTACSLKVTEVEDNKALPPETGHGFLWRMNSEWSLREDQNGVWVELRSVSLSRDTPRAVGWIVRPIIRNFPSEALMSTLKATQEALR